MVANADNIAMSFDSAKWTFICRNSCSILSKVRSDKSFSGFVSGRDCRRLNYLINDTITTLMFCPQFIPTATQIRDQFTLKHTLANFLSSHRLR